MYIIIIEKLITIQIHYVYQIQIISPISRKFFFNFAIQLFKHNKINKTLINLLNSKQLFYRLLYSLKLIKIKILKTYIKANLADSFISYFKLLIIILILFI